MAPPLRYVFGDHVLVPDERTLTTAGAPVKLGGRAFDLLLTLVEHRDRTVGKRELLERVWPKLVVEENNLQVQVAGLRKLLGAQAIATIPGRGYRFMLGVRVDGDVRGAEGTLAPTIDGFRPPGSAQLPARLPALFGRDADLARVRSLLAEHAVVTVAGAGGIGKTRLAQHVAAAASEAHGDGVRWIELAALAEGDLVVPAVARGLGLPAAGGDDPLDAILAALRPRRMLLVLDNCEHLVDAVAAFVDALTAEAPGVRVLVTSQEPLRAAHEQVYRLGPLALTDAGDPSGATRAGAVELFAARAAAVDPRFVLDAATSPTVREICRRLDGIPLAIELAAARLPLLGLDGLLARLDERFKLLTAGSRLVLRRHQTLRAALEWSHGLLTPGEQRLLRRLGVFAGSFSLDFAQAVARDGDHDEWAVLDHLGALVDKSLVVAEGDPLPRYRLLETTRAFALEKLAEAGETERALRLHAQALVDWLDPLIERRRRSPLDPREESLLRPELDNVRAALDWAARSEDDGLAIALAGVAWIVWAYADATGEGWQRCVALRDRVRPDVPARTAAQFWSAITALGIVAAKRETMEAAQREVDLLHTPGDEHKRYVALTHLASIAARRGEATMARSAIDEAATLIRPEWPRRHQALLPWALRCWCMLKGLHEEALSHSLHQAELYADEDELYHQWALGALVAECELVLGRLDRARARALAALALPGTRAADWGYVHEVLATAATLQGRADEAIAHGRTAHQGLRHLDDEGRLLETMALNAAMQGRLAEAAQVAGHVDTELLRRGALRWPCAEERRHRLDKLVQAGLGGSASARHLATGRLLGTDRAFALAFGDAVADS
ncbi:MAG TPA: winged helix-turn-helix domain-containing protein [Casimicrobiaceae bacterium]